MSSVYDDHEEELINKINKLKERLEELEEHTRFLHYCSDAHSLYWLEQTYKIDRNDIVKITPAGGFGYVMCYVHLKNGDEIYISDEVKAGFLLSYVEYKEYLKKYKDKE